MQQHQQLFVLPVHFMFTDKSAALKERLLDEFDAYLSTKLRKDKQFWFRKVNVNYIATGKDDRNVLTSGSITISVYPERYCDIEYVAQVICTFLFDATAALSEKYDLPKDSCKISYSCSEYEMKDVNDQATYEMYVDDAVDMVKHKYADKHARHLEAQARKLGI